MKKFSSVFAAIVLMVTLFASCSPASNASHNVSVEADRFQVTRKITVVNMRTDKIMFEIEGTFSLKNNSTNELEIVCQVGAGEYKKHFVYLNDWTSYVMEDVSGAGIDPYQYNIRVYPQLPDVNFGG